MLILTRKVGETVVIGNEVYCTVLEYPRDGQCTLAFDAPKNMPIHRFEIQKRIMQKIKEGNYEVEKNLEETVIERLTKLFRKDMNWN